MVLSGIQANRMALAAAGRRLAHCAQVTARTVPTKSAMRSLCTSIMDMDISPQVRAEECLSAEIGATTSLIVAQTDASQTVVDGWDDYGYKINGIYMRGSVLAFPNFTLLWDAQQVRW